MALDSLPVKTISSFRAGTRLEPEMVTILVLIKRFGTNVKVLTCSKCRLATVASGAASGKLLQYEVGGPRVSVQTAYGVEVEVYDMNLIFHSNNYYRRNYRNLMRTALFENFRWKTIHMIQSRWFSWITEIIQTRKFGA